MIVKNGDTAEDLEIIVYDPGAGTIPANQGLFFMGWTTNPDYTTADGANGMTIADVRAWILSTYNAENPITEHETVNFYAMIFKLFNVTYLGEDGLAVGMETVYLMPSVSSSAYTVNMAYTPNNPDVFNFEGWHVNSGSDNISGYVDENTLYQNGQEVTLSGNVIFSVYAPEGHWLVFNENGKGATYNAPQFVKSGEVTVTVPDPQRFGYSFDGWYYAEMEEQVDDQGNTVMVPKKDADGNVILAGAFSFGSELTEKTTIFAKWVSVATANYTVIVWFEQSGDTYAANVASGERNYDFYTSYTFTGTTGETVTPVTNAASSTSDINGTYPNARIRGTQTNGNNLDQTITITGYHQNTELTETSGKVAPEGTTVINVYYDRHTVRYTFYYPFGASGAYVLYNGNSDGSYYIPDGNGGYTGPYAMTFVGTNDQGAKVWEYQGGSFTYTPHDGTDAGSYYIAEGEGYAGPYEMTYSDGKWTYAGDAVQGYYLTDSTTSGTYYIPDGNGGYVQKSLNRDGDHWTYGTGEYEYVVSTSTSSGNYYIPDGNGGYVQRALTRSGNAWTYTTTETLPSGTTRYYQRGGNGTNPTQYGLVNGALVELSRNNNAWRYRDANNNWVNYSGNRYSVTSGNNGTNRTQFALINGQMVQLSRSGNNWTYTATNTYDGPVYVQQELQETYNGDVYLYGWYNPQMEYTGTVYDGAADVTTYTGDVYTRGSSGNSWQIYSQQVGLYGESLAWPENSNIWWYPNGDNNGNTSGTRMTYKDDFIPMTADMDVSYYGRTGTGNNTIRFYTEDLAGGTYSLAVEVGSSAQTFNINDKFTGFQAYQYRSYSSGYGGGSWSNWTNVGTLNPSTGIYGSGVAINSILEIRYQRLYNHITFMDGKYVNGNNVDQGETPHPDYFMETDEMFFETDLSSYNVGGANYYTPPTYHDGYVFAGWYADDACTHPYTFTTMPVTGVTVYAKWVQVQYRVFLHPNAGTDPTLDWGSEDQAMNFRVSYGDSVDVPTGIRQAYVFVGWYTDAACTQVFNEDLILNDSTVTAAYDKTADMTDAMDKWGNVSGDSTHDGPWNSDAVGYNGGDRFWITKKLDLYAKWRAILVGADGIGLEYDANGGTNAPTDPAHYPDATWVTAQAASTAPEGERFLYWVVQTWNGTAFEDTTVKVYPGDTFEVLLANAHQVANADNTPEHPSYTYTVRLRAQYGPLSDATPTHIYWYSNYGETAQVVKTNTTEEGEENVEALPINMGVVVKPADTFSKDGYMFLGWARMPEPQNGATSVTIDGVVYKYENGVYTVDGATLDEDDLFLTYDEATGKFTRTGTAAQVSYVAADEDEPYHGMYAVWKKLPTLRVVKVDADTVTNQTPTYLADAQFTLTLSSETVGTVTTVANADGVLIAGLADGHYVLTEIAAPDGYVIQVDGIWLHVYNGVIYTKFDSEAEGAAAYSKPLTADTDDPTIFTITVENHLGTALPRTGGMGVQNLMYLGGTLCALALILLGRQMILRRKHEKD